MFNFLKKTWNAVKAFFKKIFSRAKRMSEKAQTVVKLATFVAIVAGLLVGGAFAMQGLALGLLVVAGMMITMSVIPGMWWFSTTSVGYIFVVLSTAWLTHFIVGSATLVGLFALAWAITLKMFVLKIAHYRMAMGESPLPFGEKPNTNEVNAVVTSVV